jgi:uncharacterized protein (TIGR02996 family)
VDSDPTLKALLAAICADPADDTPRRVYADRCEETGDSDRAEFVRVQLELAQWKADAAERSLSRDGISLYAGLRRREWELLEGRGAEWLPDVPGFTFAKPPACETFRRGFVAHLTISDEALPHLDAIRAASPIEAVTLTTLPPVFGPPLLRRRETRGYLLADTTHGPQRVFVTRSGEQSPDEVHAVTLELLERTWPGIRFTLPPAIEFRHFDPAELPAWNLRPFTREELEQLARAHGLPPEFIRPEAP